MSSALDYTSYIPEKKSATNHIALSNRALSTSTLSTAPIKCDTCSSHIYPASVPTFHMKNGSDALSPPFVSIENSFRTKETPISVVLTRDTTKDVHEINVLTNDPFHGPDSDYYIGDYTEQPSNRNDSVYYVDKHATKHATKSTTKSTTKHATNSTTRPMTIFTDKKNDDSASDESAKMDIYTNIYVGSITVVALYLVYRLLLK